MRRPAARCGRTSPAACRYLAEAVAMVSDTDLTDHAYQAGVQTERPKATGLTSEVTIRCCW
jgi:hypothetical protein